MKTRLCLPLVALVGLLLVAAVPPGVRAAEKFDFGLVFWPPDGMADHPEKYVAWSKVLAEFKNNLGRAKQFNYFADVCYAGIAKFRSDPEVNNANAPRGIDLGMPYTLSLATTSSSKTRARTMWFDKSDNDRGNGRLKVGESYYFSFDAYLTKRLKTNDPIPTVKQLFDAAKADVLADTDMQRNGRSQTPDFVVRNSGNENLKIKGDAEKSHALIFGAYMQGMYDPPHDESYRALNAYGFDSIAMYRHNDANPQRDPPIQGDGTWGNFKTSLANLKTKLAEGNAATQVVNLFHLGHGTREAKDDGRGRGLFTGEPGPGEGYVLAGTDWLSIPMDADFWSTLKVGLRPPGSEEEEGWTRIDPPHFSLAYADMNVSQEFSISIGGSEGDLGLPLGTFMLSAAEPSGTLFVELDDSFLDQLITLYDGASRLYLHFDLAQGEAGDDWIRLGVLEDLLENPDYRPLTYGTGLTTVIAGVPEPTALALLLIGFGLRPVRRRRTRPTARTAHADA